MLKIFKKLIKTIFGEWVFIFSVVSVQLMSSDFGIHSQYTTMHITISSFLTDFYNQIRIGNQIHKITYLHVNNFLINPNNIIKLALFVQISKHLIKQMYVAEHLIFYAAGIPRLTRTTYLPQPHYFIKQAS